MGWWRWKWQGPSSCLPSSCCLPAGRLHARLFPVCPRFLRQWYECHVPCGVKSQPRRPRDTVMAPEVVVANSRCCAGNAVLRMGPDMHYYCRANCNTVNHHHAFITTFSSSLLGRYVHFPSLPIPIFSFRTKAGKLSWKRDQHITGFPHCIQSCAS